MVNNKLLTAKEAALKDLEREMKAIDELASKVSSQINRLEIERMDMEDRRQKDENTACSSASINQTTSDPTIIHQTSSEATIPIYVESQQINETDLNLSITAALEFRNNCNYDENSDYEDST